MGLSCRRLNICCMVVALSVFFCIVFGLHISFRSVPRPKVLVPFENFWHRLLWKKSFWNREKQRMDVLHNPLFNWSHSPPDVPDWFNDTASLNLCEPDNRVQTQIQDYNTLPQHLQDFLLYMRCRTYPMLIDQRNVCRNKPYLLLVVKSLVQHFDRRQAIRETWGRAGIVANRTVATVFLLGSSLSTDYLPDLQGMLSHEAKFHKDIIQWHYRDTFFNLTLKEVLFLDWFSRRCPHTRYVFKGDDDVIVNTFRIVEFLKNLPPHKSKELFVGSVIRDGEPKRDQTLKYFIPKSVFEGQYPPYALGAGYLFSGDLALRLHSVSHLVPLYPIDDVYTGMCLEKLGLSPKEHSGFKIFDIDSDMTPCMYRGLMIVHNRTPLELLTIWPWIIKPELDCQ